MLSHKSFDATLEAHTQWKRRLLDAIIKGKSDYKVELVREDNGCQFGQWLYALPQEIMESENFKTVQKLHAEFHKVASDILALALKGKKEEALAELDHQRAYARISEKLFQAMIQWRDNA